MSNGDDVLENWEEIDETGLNSTVQKLKASSTSSCEEIKKNCYRNTNLTTSSAALTSSTGPSKMKVLQRSNAQDSMTSSSMSKPLTKSPLDDMSDTFQPVLMVLHKPQDEYQSANYTAPIANQTVKILRRPTQSTENRNNCIRPKQPIKTLQQREQEYAEARLRILGSAKNPEDEEQRNLSAIATTSVVTSITTNSIPSAPTVTTTTITATAVTSNNSIANMVTTAKINSPKAQVGANVYNNHYNQQLQQQQKYLQNCQQQQQQQQHNFFYNQSQQQQPQQHSPAYNNNRTFSVNPLLTLGPMGAIGQPAQYHATTLPSPLTQQQQLKFHQYHQKPPQQQQKSQQQQQQQQTWSPVVGGSVSSSSIRQQPNDTILRVPRGPDGSAGFQMRR